MRSNNGSNNCETHVFIIIWSLLFFLLSYLDIAPFSKDYIFISFLPHLLTQYLHHQSQNLGIIITLVKQTYIKKTYLFCYTHGYVHPILFAKCTTNYFTDVFYFLLPQPFPLLFGFLLYTQNTRNHCLS